MESLHSEAGYMTASVPKRVGPFESPLTGRAGPYMYLRPTVAGTTHDKKATDDAQIAYPHNVTLDKDTGFQGYEPAGTQTRQPKKSPKGKR